ncbi:transcriptional antiterminator [Streptomyces sp. Z26]|uniref:transcriptional antiterminator n=1 Tax=Streptomyces sp. Z26 TaxID=2500177 RepID=UPI000EF157FB|nr:transcriptional antiterminator [Streptomyces sp. Z26]RLL66036.1 transcriptional antiterminator [Streptomyces sp. Z26]
MDEQLALRLRLFREGGQVPATVVDFVADELTALEAEGHTITEATAGMLTSHLTMAFGRLLRGEPIDEFSADAQVAAELADHPEAVARARAISVRAEARLGAALPESEVNFLGLHLAVLAQRPPPTPAP